MLWGTSGATWQPMPMFLTKAFEASSSTTPSASSRGEKGCGSMSMRPASILE